MFQVAHQEFNFSGGSTRDRHARWVEVGYVKDPRRLAGCANSLHQVVDSRDANFGKRYATSGMAKKIAGGWQVNGVFSAISGTPFTVTASGTALNAPANTQTADQVKPTVARFGNVGPAQYFYDPTAFAPVNQPRFGTSGLNILRIPNWINMDVSVFRRFSLRERFELELHGDAFNSLNTPHFDAPNGNINSTSFMQITSAEPDQRQLRIGLRLTW